MEQDALEHTFTETFAAYSDAIFRFCILKVSDEALAQDMTQETFMRYWHYLRAGKEMRNTRALLYTIAGNLAKDWYKKKKSESLDLRMERGSVPAERSIGPETAASYAEIIHMIDDMEEKDKEVLILRFVEEIPPKDIAIILGESANTISVRINRATKRLQELLHI